MRFGHEDPELAAQFRVAGRFKDPGSRVLVRKDGSLRLELAGCDMSELREMRFSMDRFTCVDGGGIGWGCKGRLELSHDPARSKSEGSDEIDKVFTRCQFHHRKLDFHGKDGHF